MGIASRTSEPSRALDNLLTRDRLFTERVGAEARRLGLHVVDVDVGTARDELVTRVAGLTAPLRSDARVADFPPSITGSSCAKYGHVAAGNAMVRRIPGPSRAALALALAGAVVLPLTSAAVMAEASAHGRDGASSPQRPPTTSTATGIPSW